MALFQAIVCSVRVGTHGSKLKWQWLLMIVPMLILISIVTHVRTYEAQDCISTVLYDKLNAYVCLTSIHLLLAVRRCGCINLYIVVY
jgi:hypothetical protein